MEDLGSRTKRIVFLWEDNFSPRRNCVIFSRCHFCIPSDLISILVKWFSSPQTTWREIYFLNFTKIVFREVILNIHTNVLQQKFVCSIFMYVGKLSRCFMLQHFEGLIYIDLSLFSI